MKTKTNKSSKWNDKFSYSNIWSEFLTIVGNNREHCSHSVKSFRPRIGVDPLSGKPDGQYTAAPYCFWVRGPFAFRQALILHGMNATRSWKHPPVLHHTVAVDLPAAHSTTSKRGSIELRSGDCGGHLCTVNSSCSRNQNEMIWALWHGALSLALENGYTVS